MDITEMLYRQKSGIIYNALSRTLQPGYFFGPHCHKNVELCVMKKGECDITVNSEVITVRGGELMVIFSHMVHTFHMRSTRPAVFLQMHFDPESFLHVSPTVVENVGFLHSMADEHSSYLHQPCSPDLVGCVERVCREMRSPDEAFSGPLSQLYIHELIFLLSRETDQSYRQVFSIGNPLAISAIQFISDRMDQRISLQDVARHCKVTVRHLSGVFKTAVNITVNDYINIAKIDRAMRYILETDNDMTTIASKLGFSSAQYFSTIFKKYTHVTPTEFRNMSDKDI